MVEKVDQKKVIVNDPVTQKVGGSQNPEDIVIPLSNGSDRPVIIEDVDGSVFKGNSQAVSIPNFEDPLNFLELAENTYQSDLKTAKEKLQTHDFNEREYKEAISAAKNKYNKSQSIVKEYEKTIRNAKKDLESYEINNTQYNKRIDYAWKTYNEGKNKILNPTVPQDSTKIGADSLPKDKTSQTSSPTITKEPVSTDKKTSSSEPTKKSSSAQTPVAQKKTEIPEKKDDAKPTVKTESAPKTEEEKISYYRSVGNRYKSRIISSYAYGNDVGRYVQITGEFLEKMLSDGTASTYNDEIPQKQNEVIAKNEPPSQPTVPKKTSSAAESTTYVPKTEAEAKQLAAETNAKNATGASLPTPVKEQNKVVPPKSEAEARQLAAEGNAKKAGSSGISKKNAEKIEKMKAHIEKLKKSRDDAKKQGEIQMEKNFQDAIDVLTAELNKLYTADAREIESIQRNIGKISTLMGRCMSQYKIAKASGDVQIEFNMRDAAAVHYDELQKLRAKLQELGGSSKTLDSSEKEFIDLFGDPKQARQAELKVLQEKQIKSKQEKVQKTILPARKALERYIAAKSSGDVIAKQDAKDSLSVYEYELRNLSTQLIKLGVSSPEINSLLEEIENA